MGRWYSGRGGAWWRGDVSVPGQDPPHTNGRRRRGRVWDGPFTAPSPTPAATAGLAVDDRVAETSPDGGASGLFGAHTSQFRRLIAPSWHPPGLRTRERAGSPQFRHTSVLSRHTRPGEHLRMTPSTFPASLAARVWTVPRSFIAGRHAPAREMLLGSRDSRTNGGTNPGARASKGAEKSLPALSSRRRPRVGSR